MSVRKRLTLMLGKGAGHTPPDTVLRVADWIARLGETAFYDAVITAAIAAARKRLPNATDAEDVAIVVSTRLWRWSARHADKAMTIDELARIASIAARRTAANQDRNRTLRRQRETSAMSDWAETGEERESPDRVTRDDLNKVINAALEFAPKRATQSWHLVRTEKLTHAEVAARLNIAPQTVANHVHQVLEVLKEAIALYQKEGLLMETKREERS